MFVLDGKTLVLDQPFSAGDTLFPANWLRLSSDADKAAIGIQVLPDPTIPYFDKRFYLGYDSDGNLIPRDHAELVQIYTDQTFATAKAILAPSDWMVIRELDNGTAMDTTWKAWRQSVRHAAEEKVLYIGTTNDTFELAAYISGTVYPVWPLDPNYAPPAAPAPAAGV